MKKLKILKLPVMLILLFSFTSCSSPEIQQPKETFNTVQFQSREEENQADKKEADLVKKELSEEDKEKAGNDFYNYINEEWIKNAQMRPGRPANTSFDEVSEKIMNQKKELIKELQDNKDSYDENSDERKIINLYENYLNKDKRNEQGAEPLKDIIEKIEKVESVKDIAQLENEDLGSYILSFGADTDLKDAEKNSLYLWSTALTLGDADNYTINTDDSVTKKSLYVDYYKKILKLAGFSENEAEEKINNMFKFEEMIAPSIAGQQEQISTDGFLKNIYNIATIDELDKRAPNLEIKEFYKNLDIPDDWNFTILLTEPKWIDKLNEVCTKENMPLIKDYILIRNIEDTVPYLSDDFEKAASEFKNAYYGTDSDIPEDEKAISFMENCMGEAFGKLYVKKYFNPEIKEDVTKIINEVKENYEKRIENLDWMSEETKKNAIEKLKNLRAKVGYPDEWTDYSNLEIKSFDEDSSLLENINNLRKFSENLQRKKLNEPVDKTKFASSPQTVNAFYSPTDNSITIPAGILQAPFYDINASKESNYGGIGAVIGHEISHAFDNNGAQYDKNGNLDSWWSEEDYKKFSEKIKKVREYFSTVTTDEGDKVNGDLTVSENIADIGGVRCVLDLVEKMDNPSYRDFFESYASIWRMVSTNEYKKYLLQMDSHSPNKVRVNVVLPQFEEFYKTYEIDENDKMYIKPEDRLQIW